MVYVPPLTATNGKKVLSSNTVCEVLCEDGVVMKIVTPDEFKASFLSILALRKDEMVAAYHEPRQKTDLVLDSDRGILSQVASALDLDYCRGCLGVDALFCEGRNSKDGGNDVDDTAAISVAVEYEIDGSAHDSVKRLSRINAPLNIIVTYRNGKPWKRLDRYARMISEIHMPSDLAAERRQMIVFGNLQEGELFWSFFVYNGENFDRI